MGWKRMKGIKTEYTCPTCGRKVEADEFDDWEDKCVYCVYEGLPVSMPVKYTKSYGDKKNITAEAELLDELEYIPEKQSKAAKESKRKFEYKKASRKRKKSSKPKAL